MELYDPDDRYFYGTENNVHVTVLVSETYDHVRHPASSSTHDVGEIVALTKFGHTTGYYRPDWDGDSVEESIVYFEHDAGRTLVFSPSPQDIQYDAGTYRVEFAVPATPGVSPKDWDGSIKVYEGSVLKKTIPLKVKVKKGGPG